MSSESICAALLSFLPLSECMQTLSNNPNLSGLRLQAAKFADVANAWLIKHQIFVAANLIIFSIAFFYFSESESRKARTVPYKRPLPPLHLREQFAREAAAEEEKKMAALATAAGDAIVLDPPKDTPFTTEELAGFNGSVDGRPIYVAIKGLIFDVSAKKEMYGPGAGYNVFAGKDGSRGLGKSSLKLEDAVADYSTLDQSETTVLEDWVKYFKKRYNIIGRVVD